MKNGFLTGANRIPLKENRASGRVSAFARLQFPTSKQFRASFHGMDDSVHAQSQPDFSQGRALQDNGNEDPTLNLKMGHPSATQYPSRGSIPGICLRCLSDKHPRRACRSPIKCLACMGWGHIVVNCTVHNHRSHRSYMRTEPSIHNKEKGDLVQPKLFSKAACMDLGPSTSNPPRFHSFVHWWKVSPL